MNDKPDSDSELRLNAIAESFISRIRNGLFPSIEDYKKKHPELAEAIDDLFPTLAAMEKYDPVSSDNSIESANHFHAPNNLGEYRIVREIARGGMGVVYEAYHDTMRRHVALKVLPESLAKNPNHLERFIREARSAGQLHHTNIVPVFEVGEFDNVHFYAMQYIHGQNLDIVIDELRQLYKLKDQNTTSENLPRTHRSADDSISMSVANSLLGNASPTAQNSETTKAFQGKSQESSGVTQDLNTSVKLDSRDQTTGSSSNWSQSTESASSYFRRVALAGIQVAEALQFAHDHGILHRDIKPSNLILDTSGTIWVTDFGLAKNDGDNLTHTGDIVGTLRYMAPERFNGIADARSDVYSLGLTLYELCTLRHAFDELDRAKLVRQVTDRTPAAPRKIRSEIPVDLETVVIKATSREPEQRYQSARGLAEDLRRYVSDRPVMARRVSVFEQVWRWSKRNPSRAALMASLLLLLSTLFGGALFFSYINRQHANDLAAENVKFREAVFWGNVRGAEAVRANGRPGQSHESLQFISAAKEMLPELNLSKTESAVRKLRLRNDAIQSMASWDVTEKHSWERTADSSGAIGIDFAGQRLAVADAEGNISIRSIQSNELAMEFSSPGLPCWILRFSPDGRYLYGKFHLGSKPFDVHLLIWDLQNRKQVLELKHQPVGWAWFCDDSSRVVVCQELAISIFDCETGKLSKHLKFKEQPALAKFADDGKAIIVAFQQSNRLQFWAIDQSEMIREIVAPSDGSLTRFAWNDKRKQLAVAIRTAVFVWPPGDLDADPDGYFNHSSQVRRVALASHGRFAMTHGWDNSTRLFDLINKREILRIDHKFAFESFDPTGFQIGFTSKHAFGIWQIPGNNPFRTLRNSKGLPALRAVEFHPNESCILAHAHGSGVEFWDHCRNELIGRIDQEGTTDFVFDSNGNTGYLCGDNGLVRFELSLTETATGSFQMSSEFSKTILSNKLSHLRINRKHGLIAARYWNQTNRVVLVQLDSEATVQIQQDHGPLNPRITPDGRRLLTSTWRSRGVKVWNTEDGGLIDEIGVNEFYSPSVGISPVGDKFSIGEDNNFWTWNLADMKPVVKHDKASDRSHMGSIQYASNGKWLATAYSREKPRLIEIESDRTLAVLTAPMSIQVGAISLSADNRFLASVDKDLICVWDLHCIQDNLSKLGLDWN